MTVRYVSSRSAPDTVLMTFRVVHGQRAVIDGDAADDAETGRSPISRWLAWAFDYDDFVSNPDGVGYMVRLIIPRGTIGMQVFARVDTAFNGTVAIDIGDGNDTDGWADDFSFENTGIHRDANAAYNNLATDPTAGTAGWQYYSSGDTLDVWWRNATAPAAGQAIVFMRTVSYHEDANAEW